MAGNQCRIVMVTGANRGIGLELVKRFLEGPNPSEKVLATCRDPAKAQDLKTLASKHPSLLLVQLGKHKKTRHATSPLHGGNQPLNPAGLSQKAAPPSFLEVTDPASVEAAAQKAEAHLGGRGLNLLINNAGVMPPCSLELATAKDMLDVYNTNTVGPMMVTKAFLPLLKKAAHASQQKGMSCAKAAIINISTILSSIEKAPETFFSYPVVSYRCSKTALNMLTKCQSTCYKEEGILCTALHPGWVKTELGTDQADITVKESVDGLMKVLGNLCEEHHGNLVTWKGEKLPW